MIRGFLILMLVTFAGAKAEAGVCFSNGVAKVSPKITSAKECPTPGKFYSDELECAQEQSPSNALNKIVYDDGLIKNIIADPKIRPGTAASNPSSQQTQTAYLNQLVEDKNKKKLEQDVLKAKGYKDPNDKGAEEAPSAPSLQPGCTLNGKPLSAKTEKECKKFGGDFVSSDGKTTNSDGSVSDRTQASDETTIKKYAQDQAELEADQGDLNKLKKDLAADQYTDKQVAKLDKILNSTDENGVPGKLTPQQQTDYTSMTGATFKDGTLVKDKDGKVLTPESDARASREAALEGNGSDKKGSIQDKKDEIAKDKEKLNKDKDSAELSTATQEIRKKNGKDYGGHYQGADVQLTEKLNKGAEMASGLTDKLGSAATQMSSEDQSKALAEKGATATNQDVIDAHQRVADTAKAKLKEAGILNMALGLYQVFRGEEHRESITRVDKRALDATKQIETEVSKLEESKLGCNGSAPCIQGYNAQIAAIKSESNYVTENKDGETKAQTGAVMQQGMVGGLSIVKGMGNFKDANAIDVHLGQAGAGKQFNMANNQGFQGAGPTDPTLAPTVQQSEIVQNDPAAKPELGGREQFNPNDPSSAPQGPVATAWQDGPAQVGQSGGGGGVGGVGSTSAASSDTPPNAQAGAQPKAGSYASSGSGGGSYKGKSSGGSGAKVGVDSGFADLLKKFLPGGEADKKKNVNAAVNFADRSPASDQAAVISRNKNIFDEIHKRYEKKNNEGAIVF